MHFARWIEILNSSAGMAKSQTETTIVNVEDLVRLRASTDENESTVVEWQGQAFLYKPGELPSLVFNVQGMNIARAKKLEDGSWDLLSRELQLYLDPKTNEILHVWHNPYSGEDVNVIHVQNNPVQLKFPPFASYQARPLPGGRYTLNTSIPLAYPNPLNPAAKPDAPFARYAGLQAKYAAIESFTFTISGDELDNKSLKSLPSTQINWTRTSPLLPWMGTPDTGVSLLFIATGAKVAEGWEGLSPVLRDTIDKKLPAYKDAPKERTNASPGVSSWSYFMKPDVFEAWKKGEEFPLKEE